MRFLRLTLLFSLVVVLFMTVSVYAAGNNDALMSDGERQEELAFLKNLSGAVEREMNVLVANVTKDAGPVVGVGMRFSAVEVNGQQAAKVVVVFPGKPADKSGMKVDDVVLSVNGKSYPTREKLLAEFAKDIRGDNAAGRTVTFVVDRAGSRLTVKVVTGVLRGDKTDEAKKLQATIASEGATLKAKLLSAADTLDKALQAGPIKMNDTRLVAFDSLVDEFFSWLSKKSEAISELLGVK